MSAPSPANLERAREVVYTPRPAAGLSPAALADYVTAGLADPA